MTFSLIINHLTHSSLSTIRLLKIFKFTINIYFSLYFRYYYFLNDSQVIFITEVKILSIMLNICKHFIPFN